MRVWVISAVVAAVLQSAWGEYSQKLDRFPFVLNITKPATSLKDLFPTSATSAPNNLFVGSFGPGCRSIFQSQELLGFHGVHRTTGQDYISTWIFDREASPELAKYFPGAPKSCAWIAFVPKGEDPKKQAQYKSCDDATFRVINEWIASQLKTKFSIRNARTGPGAVIDVFWLPEGGGERLVSTVPPGQSSNQFSTLGHTFLIRDKQSHKLLKYLVSSKRKESFDVGIYEEANINIDSKELEKSASTALRSHFLSQRFGMNLVQPHLVRALTPVGFEKRRCPAALWEEILEFWNKNSKLGPGVPGSVETIEESVGVCLNQDKAPSSMIHLTKELKQKIYNAFKPLLEEWAGMRLQESAIYGIRRYVTGAELEMHVDTITTHVVSAIINVAQDVDEDWLLKIVDHEGILHEIIMRPGDAVFYESAKALHGRPDALVGKYYSNFFLHFRPENPDLWDYAWV